MNIHRLITGSTMALAVALAAGCGGGGGGGTPTPTTPLSGVAFDGYLKGALVCADLNRNKNCDAGEPNTQTGNGGTWTLNLTAAQQVFPIVLQADADTIDEDNPDEVVDSNLKYSAPAGSTVVNALTTIVQSVIEEKLANDPGALTKTAAALAAEANAEVAASLGATGINLLTTDIIAGKNDTSAVNRDLLSKLHVANQAVTQAILATLPGANANSGGNDAAAFNATIANIDLAAVNSAVETATQGLTGDELANTTVIPTVAVEIPSPTDIAAQAAQDAVANANASEQPAATGATGSAG